jgi:endogenous inhibitor of DNA gyrase (YacG/DUF329 family)
MSKPVDPFNAYRKYWQTLQLANSSSTRYMPLIVRGNILQSRGRVDWLPDGNVTQPALTFVSDNDTGFYRVSNDDIAISTGGVSRLRLNSDGAIVTGNLATTGHASITGNLATTGHASITGNLATTGHASITGNLDVTGFITGQGLAADLAISNVQICDSSWTPVDDTHVGLTEGYILVNGVGLAPGSAVQIGGVNAPAVSYVSGTQLRVQTPAKSTGTYNVTVVRGDTKTATLTSAISYSQDVVFTTASTLRPVYQYLPFTETITATSDSNVMYSNITALPVQVTLDANSGLLEANIGSSGGNVETLFSFDLKAEDDELQDAIQTFLLQYYPFAAGKIVPSDSEASAYFGQSCSISSDGTRAIVGAYADDATGGANSGAAYIFVQDGSSWVQESKLVPSDSEASAQFGWSCSISSDGTRAIVGAQGDDATGGTDSGAAYVFTRSGTSWAQESKLVPSDSEASAYFGWSCSISSDGTRAIVGAYLDDATGGANSGAAYVFTRSGTSWAQESKLVPSDSEANAYFGYSCSISNDGTRAIVGAAYDDATGGANSGAAYVFTRSGTSWAQESKLVPSDSEMNANFGWSCSISSDGTRAIVGAYLDDATGGADSGAAYIFVQDGSSWVQESKLVPSDSEAGARIGSSCSISDDGTRAIVGAYWDDATGGADSGAAYLFQRTYTGWVETAP